MIQCGGYYTLLGMMKMHKHKKLDALKQKQDMLNVLQQQVADRHSTLQHISNISNTIQITSYLLLAACGIVTSAAAATWINANNTTDQPEIQQPRKLFALVFSFIYAGLSVLAVDRFAKRILSTNEYLNKNTENMNSKLEAEPNMPITAEPVMQPAENQTQTAQR